MAPATFRAEADSCTTRVAFLLDRCDNVMNFFSAQSTIVPVLRIETAAQKDLPLSTILFYGPPGTGKTELAKSFVHLDFQVFIFPCHILRDEPMFREVFCEISRRLGKKKQIAIVDDAEFFFNVLGRNTAGMRTSARDELESQTSDDFFNDTRTQRHRYRQHHAEGKGVWNVHFVEIMATKI